MLRPQGYAQLIGAGRTVKECDTMTCSHCNNIVHIKPMCDPAEVGGLCKMCMKYICPSCVGKGCVPFEKKLQEQEARYHTKRWLDEVA